MPASNQLALLANSMDGGREPEKPAGRDGLATDASDGGTTQTEHGGCGCESAPSAEKTSASWLLLLSLLIFFRRHPAAPRRGALGA